MTNNVVKFQKRGRAFDFTATSRDTKTTPLKPKGEPTPEMPFVFYEPKVWHQIWHIVSRCQKEVGWLGLVEELDNGDYLVTEIFVPEQIVTGAETDIDADALATLAMDLLDQGKDTGQLFYWGHSHVNMDVGPSGQDEDQVDEYLEHNNIFIRGIYNKSGKSKVDVFDKANKLVHQCVPNEVYTPPLSDSEVAELDQLIKTNVKERTYQAPPSRSNVVPTHINGGGATHPQDKSLASQATAAMNGFYYEDEDDFYNYGYAGYDYGHGYIESPKQDKRPVTYGGVDPWDAHTIWADD